jgi:raffinose synthase
VYAVMLPLLEGQFRAALQGNERDELEITLESGKIESQLAGVKSSSCVSTLPR